MSKSCSKDSINLAKAILDPYPFQGRMREEIVDTVVRYGVLDFNAKPIQGSKEAIFDYYLSKRGTQAEFGEFLCELYSHNRYTPVALFAEDGVPYAPYDMFYNQAGLQFKFKDKNRNIHLECICWSEVARRIGRMIRHKEYLSDVPLSELRKNRSNRDAR